MELSLYDIAFHYIESAYEEDPGAQVKAGILNDFKYLLHLGWTGEDICKAIRTYQHKYNMNPNLLTLMVGKPKEPNLIHPNIFYYHNELRIMPPAPKRHFDLESGTIIKKESEFFLEMRASYILEDLVDYYIRIFDIQHINKNQLFGAFKYIMKDACIEDILYMIDVARDNMQSGDRDRSQMTPFRLTDYRSKAMEVRREKETGCRLAGSDRVVPRRRVFSFRSWNSVSEGEIRAEHHA